MRSPKTYLPFIALAVIYLIFPTRNANIDSWFYAASVKHNQELFHSHHLLYNVIGRGWYNFLETCMPGIEAIDALNIMNAMAAALCLPVFRAILLKLGTESRTALQLTLFCGVSFGFMRYATDAETYILPLLFSLVSTYYFANPVKKNHLLVSGLFSALAILVHQLHIWWTLAMFLSLVFGKPFRSGLLWRFLCPLLLVPLVYMMVFQSTDTGEVSFWQFINGEYAKGNASVGLGLKGLLFTCINFLRTFLQVHGQIADFISSYPTVYLGLIAIIIALKIYFLKTGRLTPKLRRLPVKGPYFMLFLFAFIFHLAFAALSSGNAEFMVMLPFLLILLLVSSFRFESHTLIPSLTVLLCIWNLSMAIIPARVLDLIRVDKQAEFTINHPDDYFLWKHKPLVENVVTYQKGFNQSHKYIPLNPQTGDFVDSLLRDNVPVYTDFGNPGTGFSRESLQRDPSYINGRYELKQVVSWKNIYGENHIYLISKKGD